MIVVEWLEHVGQAAFTEPLTALVIGVVIGGIIGYMMAASGGFGLR